VVLLSPQVVAEVAHHQFPNSYLGQSEAFKWHKIQTQSFH